MDVNELVAQLRSQVENARSMPMSASAVINRAEMLDLVARLERALPTAFASQDEVLSGRDDVVSRAHAEAARIRAEAKLEQERLVGETDVFRLAKHEADAERQRAAVEAEELRQETDDYVDTRLATFEIALTKTLEAVSRGRARLQGRTHFDALAETARPAGEDVRHDGVEQAGRPERSI